MDSVAAVLAREFPGREPASVRPLGRGNRKRTALVTFRDGGRVVVQAGPRAAMRTEVALARAVRARTDVPVPRVLAAGAVGDAGYAVVEHAPGEDCHERFVALDAEDRRAVARTFGRALAELHEAFAFDGYGTVLLAGGPGDEESDREREAAAPGDAPASTAGDPTFVATGGEDWPAWLRDYLAEGLAALPESLAAVREPVRAALADATLPEAPPSRLYPWDLRPGNALVADGRVTAMVDWGDPLAAPPALALAKVEHLVADWYVADGAPLRAALREGYAAVRPVPDVPRVYRLAAVVHSAVDSRGEVTRPGYPERTGDEAVAFHRAALRRWC